MAIYITGDIHAQWIDRFKMAAFPEQKEMTKDDYVIVCGDFGIWDNSDRENYELDWLNDRNFTILFVEGNHENYDMLDAMPIEEWHGGKVHKVRESVIHLMRGQIFEIDGLTFFTFGGASSHDIADGILEIGDPRIKQWRRHNARCGYDGGVYKQFRVNHKSWWERELPSQEEMDEGLTNLKKYNNKVDYIITHSPYSSIIKQLDAGCGLYETDYLSDYLQKIKNTVDYRGFFCGHMHVEQCFEWDRTYIVFYQFVRIA